MIAKTKSKQGTALITGASSGIGLELACLFARDGYDLVLVARNKASLENLARELRCEYGVRATVILQDLANSSAAQAILEQLKYESIEIDVLVNNAGTQVYGEFATSSLEKQLAMIQVNVNSLVHLTHLLLPGMIRRGHGRILNVGSTGSFAPGPLNAVYCATKAFVLSLSEAIGAEVSGTGVMVTVLCPGPTKTAFITRHAMQDVRIFRHAMSPVRVAEIGYRALQQARPLVIAGFINRLQVFSFQLMAPFLELTPPAILMSIGRLFMGRSNTKRQQIEQI
jgi:short-subunit dehydrogenase